MSALASFTKYDIAPRVLICTNPQCGLCPPGYGKFEGKKTKARCLECNERLTEIKSEPRR